MDLAGRRRVSGCRYPPRCSQGPRSEPEIPGKMVRKEEKTPNWSFAEDPFENLKQNRKRDDRAGQIGKRSSSNFSKETRSDRSMNGTSNHRVPPAENRNPPQEEDVRPLPWPNQTGPARVLVTISERSSAEKPWTAGLPWHPFPKRGTSRTQGQRRDVGNPKTPAAQKNGTPSLKGPPLLPGGLCGSSKGARCSGGSTHPQIIKRKDGVSEGDGGTEETPRADDHIGERLLRKGGDPLKRKKNGQVLSGPEGLRRPRKRSEVDDVESGPRNPVTKT